MPQLRFWLVRHTLSHRGYLRNLIFVMAGQGRIITSKLGVPAYELSHRCGRRGFEIISVFHPNFVEISQANVTHNQCREGHNFYTLLNVIISAKYAFVNDGKL
jgi:hypothetical protein